VDDGGARAPFDCRYVAVRSLVGGCHVLSIRPGATGNQGRKSPQVWKPRCV